MPIMRKNNATEPEKRRSNNRVESFPTRRAYDSTVVLATFIRVVASLIDGFPGSYEPAATPVADSPPAAGRGAVSDAQRPTGAEIRVSFRFHLQRYALTIQRLYANVFY